MDNNDHAQPLQSSPERPVEDLSTAVQSLDTVRALHHTVVSLRSALEDAHREIDNLKKQISINVDIDSGKEFRKSVDNLNTFDNLNTENSRRVVVENTTSSQPLRVSLDQHFDCEDNQNQGDTDPEPPKSPVRKSRRSNRHSGSYSFSVNPEDIRVHASGDPDRRRQMASKIDVKIKVSSNIKLNEAGSSSEDATTTDNNSGAETPRESEQSDCEQPTNTQISTSAKDTYTEQNTPAVPAAESAYVANSGNSSEGENSVFEDSTTKPDRPSSSLRHHEHSEEVDDIELIFSSDDKDFGQDDLVSIGGEYEPWEKTGTSGTPVLVNFGNIGSDQENDNISSTKPNMDGASKSNEELKGDSVAAEMHRDDSYDTFDPVSSSSALGRRWTNHNVLIETDISKCGIAEDGILDMGRRNTCPNPPAYRPMLHREAMAKISSSGRTPLAVKFSRNSRSHQYYPMNATARSPRTLKLAENRETADDDGPSSGPKRSASVQTEISALPEHWRSESHLVGGRYCGAGFYTLPSKFVPPPSFGCHRYATKVSNKSQEARRVLLSDINFTSMVPELSRSADHLCQENADDPSNSNQTGPANTTGDKHKGATHLRTPDYGPPMRGITPSFSMTASAGVSQWTVNENSYGTQTTQTDNHYYRGDSFDSSKSFSLSSRFSSAYNKPNRSRSVPSARCTICRKNLGLGMRTSESMHYTPRVTFQESSSGSIRGSLPDLRADCACSAGHRKASLHRKYGDSSGSTESLLDEADDFLHSSVAAVYDYNAGASTGPLAGSNRRYSENDIKRDYSPSKQSLPFLPKSPKCLKLDHLVKVISKTGRVVIGRVRYIGPLASSEYAENESFVGLQLPSKVGDCDGSIDGRRFFNCEPQHGTFVPFKKIVMAWTS